MFSLRFFKKHYDDYVDLTIGRVYIRPLLNGFINEALIKSTIINDMINNAMFLSVIEYRITLLSKSRINKLSVIDGNKLRDKIKVILERHGLLNVSKDEVKITNDDIANDEFFLNKQNDFKRLVEINK